MGFWPNIEGIPALTTDGFVVTTGNKGKLGVMVYTNLGSIGSLSNAAGWLHNNGSGVFDYSAPTPSDIGATAESGFSSPASVIVTYDSTTQKVTLTGTTTAYWQGSLIAALESGWVSTAHPDVTGHLYWLYYNGSTFLWSTDIYPGFDQVLIAFINYGSTNKFGMRECHGLMQWQCHESFHKNIGTYRSSGGTVAGYTLASITAAERRPSVSECIIIDEDLPTTNLSLADNGLYSQFYLTGAGASTYTLDAAEIIPVSGNNPYYNSFSTPNWSQTLMPGNSYATVWLLEMPACAGADNQKYRHTWVQPQWITQASSSGLSHLAAALASELQRLPSELNLGLLSTANPEFIPIARLVIAYVNGNWTLEAVTNLIGSKFALVGSPPGLFLANVSVTAPITGMGTVASPLVIPAATDSVNGYFTASDHTSLTGKISLSSTLTGFVLGTNGTALAATDTTLQAFQKLQVQVNALQSQLARSHSWNG